MSDDYAWEDYNRASDERARDADNEWRDHLDHREQERVDRLRDRGGLGERAPDPVCPACGERYINYGAHMERCYGRPTRREQAA